MIHKIYFPIFLFLLSPFFLMPGFAVKAYPHPVTVTQPDGTQLTIRIHGDEFRKFRTTEDGYLLKANAKGFLTYASRNSKGRAVESRFVARNLDNRSAEEIQFLQRIGKAESLEQVLVSSDDSLAQSIRIFPQKVYPLTGTPKALVILVNFFDKSFVAATPQTAFTNLLNQDGYSANGGTGSARDYFMSSSFGKFAPTFDVVGPFTLQKSLDYYGKNDLDGNDTLPQMLVVDACAAANATVDFTQYDTDNNGVIDNVFVYYAGYNEAEGATSNTIWPHRWAVIRNYNYMGTTASITFDGKLLKDYACTSELRGNSGSNMCGIGTFCHEFGHVLGLPDYYHTEANKNTLGYWSIMDAGAYSNAGRTPPVYSAYDRFYLGWFTPQQVSTASDLMLLSLYQGKTIPANTNNQAFLFSATTHNLSGKSPDPSEFYIVEYRKKTGWDTYLPAEGMCVWHIDYNKTAWDNNTPNNYTETSQTAGSHMRVYLRPLSGSSATPGTAFTNGSFMPVTWSGGSINRELSQIAKATDNMTFKLMGGTPTIQNTAQIKAGVVESSLQYSPTFVNSQNTKTLNIKTTDLSDNVSVAIGGTHAAMFTASATSLLKDVLNASAGTNITVTYTPNAPGTHSAVLTISGGGLNPAKVINLSGEGL